MKTALDTSVILDVLTADRALTILSILHFPRRAPLLPEN